MSFWPRPEANDTEPATTTGPVRHSQEVKRYESQTVCQAHVREVQDHQAQGQSHGHLRKPQTQAETRLKEGQKKYGCLLYTSYHIHNAPPKREGVCDKCGGALEQRDDDKPETVKRRLEVYHAETEPLKAFYARRNILRPVDNQPPIEATTQAVLKTLEI